MIQGIVFLFIYHSHNFVHKFILVLKYRSELLGFSLISSVHLNIFNFIISNMFTFLNTNIYNKTAELLRLRIFSLFCQSPASAE